jgi:hypothetical protein
VKPTKIDLGIAVRLEAHVPAEHRECLALAATRRSRRERPQAFV